MALLFLYALTILLIPYPRATFLSKLADVFLLFNIGMGYVFVAVGCLDDEVAGTNLVYAPVVMQGGWLAFTLPVHVIWVWSEGKMV